MRVAHAEIVETHLVADDHLMIAGTVDRARFEAAGRAMGNERLTDRQPPPVDAVGAIDQLRLDATVVPSPAKRRIPLGHTEHPPQAKVEAVLRPDVHAVELGPPPPHSLDQIIVDLVRCQNQL